jgi:NADPH-dependent 2,4-dienoyl-CoA reductase/sulfur reductase-like enzyme
LFSRDLSFTSPNDLPALAALRREALGLPKAPEDGGSYDLVVGGGGIAGTSAAISAARLGLRVALLQDRPVLGGNNSSEVRVWLNGGINLPPYQQHLDEMKQLMMQGVGRLDIKAAP